SIAAAPSAGANPPTAPSAAPTKSEAAAEWLREEPRMGVFHEISPICERRESLMTDPERGFAKVYSVTAPSIEPSELEKKFRAAAQKLDLSVRIQPVVRGLEANVPSELVGASMTQDLVSVIVRKKVDADAELRRFVSTGPAELKSLSDAFGGLS